MFHAGIIAVLYEPNITQQVTIDATIDLNKQHLVDVDIAQTRSFEVCVPWCQAKDFLCSLTPAQAENTVGTIASPGNFWGKANGYVNVTPLTALQSPDGDDVQVNVYIKGKNFIFNQLTDEYIPTKRILTQAQNDMEEVSCFELGNNGADDSHICENHFGERPVSIKALLNRFTTTGIVTQGGSAGFHTIQYQNIMYPTLLPSTVADSTLPPSLFNYFRYAFWLFRGGVRKRVELGCITDQTCTVRTKVVLDKVTSSTPIVSTSLASASNGALSSLRGTVEFIMRTNGGLEFEVPCYTNNLAFYSSCADPYDTTTSMLEPICTRSYTLTTTLDSTNGVIVTEDTAAAEDFVFIRMLSPPPYAYTTIS